MAVETRLQIVRKDGWEVAHQFSWLANARPLYYATKRFPGCAGSRMPCTSAARLPAFSSVTRVP